MCDTVSHISPLLPPLKLAPPLPPQAWHDSAPLVSSGKDNALRAKASLDRVRRLAAEYSDSLMRVYGTPAADLGRGLGVPPHMSAVFGGVGGQGERGRGRVWVGYGGTQASVGIRAFPLSPCAPVPLRCRELFLASQFWASNHLPPYRERGAGQRCVPGLQAGRTLVKGAQDGSGTERLGWACHR